MLSVSLARTLFKTKDSKGGHCMNRINCREHMLACTCMLCNQQERKHLSCVLKQTLNDQMLMTLRNFSFLCSRNSMISLFLLHYIFRIYLYVRRAKTPWGVPSRIRTRILTKKWWRWPTSYIAKVKSKMNNGFCVHCIRLDYVNWKCHQLTF